ncbi:hypothetical protein TNCV_596571 [Trichonephila clavipes]|nr:hypothetical protein TNCV_596571 [Trichonephila clavipes]
MAQDTQSNPSQLNQNIIVLIDRVVTAQRTCTWNGYRPTQTSSAMSRLITLLRKPKIPLNFSNSIILTNADTIARRKLTSHPVKKYLLQNLILTAYFQLPLARLRTGHFKVMKISPDDQRSFNTCLHCSAFS